jgi:HSP20 family molecular chaperone IbpA
MSSTEADPNPADIAVRETEEKARKAAEDAEQANLPYKWTQTIRDVDVTIPVPGNIKGRDLDVVLTKTKIKVAIRGQEAFIEVRRGHIFPYLTCHSCCLGKSRGKDEKRDLQDWKSV